MILKHDCYISYLIKIFLFIVLNKGGGERESTLKFPYVIALLYFIGFLKCQGKCILTFEGSKWGVFQEAGQPIYP